MSPRRKKKTPQDTPTPEAPQIPGEPTASEETKILEELTALEENESDESGPKVVSLSRELSAIGLAVRGAQLIADAAAYGFLGEEGKQESPQCISSLLSIVGARLVLLQAVLRQEADPAALWGPHNAVMQGEFRPAEDVYLTAWSRA